MTCLVTISCQLLDDNSWQVNIREKDRGWTCAQQRFDHPIPALIDALERHAGVTDAAAMLRQVTAPPIDTEDLF